MWEVIKKNPISTFAVLCVAATAGFLAYMSVWQTTVLTSSDWCAKAMRAEKLAPGQTYQQSFDALKSCNNLLLTQLEAIATDSHIDHGAFALVLVFLIVVVIAGARASFKASTSGIEGSISRDNPGDDAVPVKVVNSPAAPVPTTEAPPGPRPQ